MTANQLYKLAKTEKPFTDWIEEQKEIYGDDFLQNPESVQDILDMKEPKEESAEEVEIEDEVVEVTPEAKSKSSGFLTRTNIVFGLLIIGAGIYIYKQYKKSK